MVINDYSVPHIHVPQLVLYVTGLFSTWFTCGYTKSHIHEHACTHAKKIVREANFPPQHAISL